MLEAFSSLGAAASDVPISVAYPGGLGHISVDLPVYVGFRIDVRVAIG